MEKTFHFYKGKVYNQQGLIRALYGLEFEELKKKLWFSMIVRRSLSPLSRSAGAAGPMGRKLLRAIPGRCRTKQTFRFGV